MRKAKPCRRIAEGSSYSPLVREGSCIALAHVFQKGENGCVRTGMARFIHPYFPFTPETGFMLAHSPPLTNAVRTQSLRRLGPFV